MMRRRSSYPKPFFCQRFRLGDSQSVALLSHGHYNLRDDDNLQKTVFSEKAEKAMPADVRKKVMSGRTSRNTGGRKRR